MNKEEKQMRKSRAGKAVQGREVSRARGWTRFRVIHCRADRAARGPRSPVQRRHRGAGAPEYQPRPPGETARPQGEVERGLH